MNILLIDDHPLFRIGLEQLLRELAPGAGVLHAGSCAEGVEAAREGAVHLVFLDVGLPDCDGFECLRLLKAARPGLPVVVISGLDIERAEVERALELGAMGFVPKSENVEMVAAALSAALAGGVFLPASLYGADAARAAPARFRAEELGLTKRQGEVLALVARGLPNKSIARRLEVSVPVVKKYVSDLLAHFHVTGRTELAALMARRGLCFGAPDSRELEDE